MGGAGQVNMNSHDTKLQIKNAKYNDSGSYVCMATSVLGKAQKAVKFTVEVPPRFIHTPDRLIKVLANSAASVPCRAIGFPPPTIVWSRGFVPLPQGRTTITKNGTLNIANFGPLDGGPYQCEARNKLGSISVLTTLDYDDQGNKSSQGQETNF
ncbi:hemolin-like [Stylophora pistillata]|uniref:hemolin-like n=1 Tax=Stylophora pistillata TaxID=50429 RepID=UPI000C0505BF|nr:hemolin-like [Stylophora pistillata]